MLALLVAAGAVAIVATAALGPWFVEQGLIWQLEDDREWKPAAEQLIRERTVRAIPHLVEAALFREPEEFPRWEGEILEAFGDDAVRLLPALREALRLGPRGPGDVRLAALESLWRLRGHFSEVVPLLAWALSSDVPGVRWRAAYILAGVGPAAASAAPALVRALRDPDERVRWAAAVALASLAPAGSHAVPALTRALGDTSPLVAAAAALALVPRGARAAPAVPQLLRLLRSRKDAARNAAIVALGAVGEDAAEAVPILLGVLEEPRQGAPDTGEDWFFEDDLPERPLGGFRRFLESRDPAELAGRALGAIRCRPEAVVPALVRHLSSEDSPRRQAVAWALGRFGPAAVSAVRSLVKALPDKHGVDPEEFSPLSLFLPALDGFCVRALGRVGPLAVPALREALRSDESLVRLQSAQALGAIGPRAAAALPDLRRLLRESRAELRAAAAVAILRIEGENDEALTVLLDGPSLSRFLAAEVAAVAEGAVPLLIDALGREPAAENAARVLPHLGEKGAAAGPRLLELLREGPEQSRGSAAAALGYLPSFAEESVPELLRTLDEAVDHPSLRMNVSMSLAMLGASARAAVPRLLPLLERDDSVMPLWETVCLASVGCRDPRVGEALARCLDSAAAFFETPWLVRALAAGGVEGTGIGVTLRQALRHRRPRVRVLAAQALLRRGAPPTEVLSVLRDALSDDSPWLIVLAWPNTVIVDVVRAGWPPWFHRRRVSWEAVRALGDVGPPAAGLVPELRRSLDSPERTLRVLAARALWRVTGETRIDTLGEVLDWLDDVSTFLVDDGVPLYLETLAVLGEMGPAAAAAAPRVEELREGSSWPRVRLAAAEALAKIRGE